MGEVSPHVEEQWNSSGVGEKSWISYRAMSEIQESLRRMSQQFGNSLGVKSEITWNSRGFSRSNGILEKTAVFFRISLGRLRCFPWIYLGVRMKYSKRPFLSSGVVDIKCNSPLDIHTNLPVTPL